MNFCSLATKEDLLSDELLLPPEERAEVAHKLLLSLEEGTEDPEASTEWSGELERWARDVLDGSVKTVPWEQVEERISPRLGQRAVKVHLELHPETVYEVEAAVD